MKTVVFRFFVFMFSVILLAACGNPVELIFTDIFTLDLSYSNFSGSLDAGEVKKIPPTGKLVGLAVGRDVKYSIQSIPNTKGITINDFGVVHVKRNALENPVGIKYTVTVIATGKGIYLGTQTADFTIKVLESSVPTDVVVDDGFVSVEGGTFQMGSTAGDGDEDPVQQQVTVSTFYMSRYEVTHRQYLEFLNGAGVSAAGRLNGNEVIDMDDGEVAFSHDGTLFSFSGSGVADRIDCPVMEVTWYGAAEYANWLSAESGLTKVYTINGTSVTANWSANGYRLPTEAEWEYAARGGNASNGYLYAGSDNAGEVAWYSSNSEQSTHPVGRKVPNELGLYDMSGNVWEWCWDWYGSYSSGSQSNPRGPDSGSYRVNRGGSWGSTARDLRLAFHNGGSPEDSPGESSNNLGFRLVRR